MGDVSNGSPIAIALLCLLGVVMAGMVGGFVYNYSKGKRGLPAIPGYSLVVDSAQPEGYQKSVRETPRKP
jgi:hypothetical protein